MKPLKTCSHRASEYEGAKNSDFSRFYLILCGIMWEHILRKKLFCQTVYQNGFSSIDKAVHGAEAALDSNTYLYFRLALRSRAGQVLHPEGIFARIFLLYSNLIARQTLGPV